MNRFVSIVGAIVMAFILLFCVEYSEALTTDFHGRVQSTYVMRDYTGLQYGFMDEVRAVQWRNELKFDITVTPEYEEYHKFRIKKYFLSYRGAYDAIFDLRDRFDDKGTFDNPGLRDKGPADWELGKDDIETENDLREAFVDLAGDFGGSIVNIRIGRQLVQWGEADGFVLINQVNPFDNSTLLFFEMPEDLATPLWMGRFNYSLGYIGPLKEVGLELLLVPDIRPWQVAPADDAIAGGTGAPYNLGLWQLRRRPLRAFAIEKLGGWIADGTVDMRAVLANAAEKGKTVDINTIMNAVATGEPKYMSPADAEHWGLVWSENGHIQWKQDVPASGRLDTMEVGVRLQAGYGEFVGNLYYYHGFQNFLAVDWSQLLNPGDAWLTYPEQDLYGFSFNSYLTSINAILRGEVCLIDRMHYLSIEDVAKGALATLTGADPTVKGIGAHETYYYLLGLDKDFWIKWLNRKKMISTSWQVYWRHIAGWKHDPAFKPFYEHNNYRITGYFFTDYIHGRIHPELFFQYDPKGVWMTMASVKYSKDGRLFYKLTQISFWGNRGATEGVVDGAITDFTQPFDLIPVSEISFRVGYNW